METFRVFNHQQHDSVAEYFLADALGSVRQLADSSGEVVLARSYDPYGNLVENTAYEADPKGFHGWLESSFSRNLCYY